MKNTFFALLAIFLLVTACESETEKSNTAVTVAETPQVADAPSSNKQYDFPVYQSFDELEYIFEQKTDTTYVINFWATWCKPCVEELPYFEKLHEEYVGEKIKVILVSLDFEKQIDKKLVPFLKERQLKSEVMMLADSKYNNWIDRVDPDWGGAIPITVVYKGDNRQFFGEQFADFAELSDLVKKVKQS